MAHSRKPVAIAGAVKTISTLEASRTPELATSNQVLMWFCAQLRFRPSKTTTKGVKSNAQPTMPNSTRHCIGSEWANS